MFPKVIARLNINRKAINAAFSRNLGSTAVLLKNDPIQQLYLDKVREFYKRKAASPNGIVDATPESQKHLKDELEKISKQYGASATNEFPTFNFTEPKIELSADRIERPKI